MNKLPDLEEILSYQNPRVVKMYQDKYPNNILSAEQAQQETLKYLWLVKKHAEDKKENPGNMQLDFKCVMLNSMLEIDSYWHEFILFTEDYHEFCNRYFGGYFHHLPNVFENEPLSPDETEESVEKLLSYVYDTLGEETMHTWFASYIVT
jgi:hypothetical protein